MEMSPEYQTLVCHTADLQLAVKMELISLGAKLVSVGLITPDQYEKIRNPYRQCESRATDLVCFIQIKVQQHPRWYGVFVNVLKGNRYVL